MAKSVPSAVSDLTDWVKDARGRTFELVDDLTDRQLMGDQLSIVNPLLWEIGHAAWFQEKWILRHACGHEPLRPEVDALYDSTAIAHDTRWNLPLFARSETYSYLHEVRDHVLEELETRELDERLIYFTKLSVFHEDMHTEAFTYTRQTLGYPPPCMSIAVMDCYSPVAEDGVRPALCRGDAEHPGGIFLLGASEDEPFLFDNEKWAHSVDVKPFAMFRTAVTQAEFAVFVEDDGYGRRELWCPEGWRWREQVEAEIPVYWERQANGNWQRRDFDRWVLLEPNRPMLHVNWYEADAYCRWSGRRLPTEAEWEFAAAVVPHEDGSGVSGSQCRYPWGDDDITSKKAHLDWRGLGTVDVDRYSAGDTVLGCRQMIGNVWEWTADDFLPYPGFVADPYKEYSDPWFGTRKVLRGGCWTTRSRMLRNTWRNFYTPDRRDVWAGFRTCAL